MKRIVVLSLFLFSAMFYACNQPGPTQAVLSGSISLVGYGESIDSSYFKVWSDSSWEAFYGDTTINGVTYTTLLDAYGNKYFYDSLGYAGFDVPQLFGDTTIVFGSPLPSLPDTVTAGLTYGLQTTFTVQGTSFLLTDEETLFDTSAITTPFGTFNGCPGIQSSNYISTGGTLYASSDENYWLAQGPSDIEQDLLDVGYSILMEYGVVNGKGWGVTYPKQRLGGIHRTDMVAGSKTSGRSTFDMHSLGPVILKGIIHKLRVD